MIDSLSAGSPISNARKRFPGLFLVVAVLVAAFVTAATAQRAPSPKSVLGFHPTDERTIADWNQIVDYFKKLDAGSQSVTVREFGRSTLGRPMIAAFISAPENLRNLEKIRKISEKLANPQTIRDAAELEALVRDGKTIVSIACSIHSTEIVASQMSMNLAYELATATDETTRLILRNTVLILIPSSNPDGIDIVADWYRKTLNTKSEGTAPPELYHHYAGHDNNRDWFMLNLRETQAITRLYWQQWFPQIVYDVHQQGQTGARMTIPPFFDPPNPRIAPLILRELGLLGYKMAADLQGAGIAGVATNATYDTWWHGGYRSAPYFHNSIGILSEAASANLMTPVEISRAQLERSSSRGLKSALETATNFPEAWQGGKWGPADIARTEMIASRAVLEMAAKFRPRYLRNFHDLGKANLAPAQADPQAYVITAGQPNAEAISRFLEILMWQGVEVFEMTEEGYFAMDPQKRDDFHEMPLGSFLVLTSQPQKNNILSLFERQVYPQRLGPNGEAEAPYDVAGWTLPLQMGFEADAVWATRDFEKYRTTLRRIGDINQARARLNLKPATEPFGKVANPLRSSPRIGLYKPYISSMDEGWTRFVFDTFQIPYKSVSNADFRSGKLDYDVLVLAADSDRAILEGFQTSRYPEEFSGGIGMAGVENLKKFVESGGKLICFDDSCELVIKRFGLGIRNALAELRRNEFYNPGSIVRLDVDRRSPLAAGMFEETPAYFTNSSAFEVAADAPVRTVARYARRDALMSGWMLGEKYLNGKAALIEADYGKGRIVLFGFRPQHRGQSWGTFRFIFNALEK